MIILILLLMLILKHNAKRYCIMFNIINILSVYKYSIYRKMKLFLNI